MNGKPLPNVAAETSAFVIRERVLYLDTAAMGPPLRAVRKAADAALHQGPLSGFSVDWRERVERVRTMAAQLFDGDADGVALVPSAAYGLSVAARNVPLRPTEAVLVLEGQFPSNLLAWQQRCAQVGARLVTVRCDAQDDWTAAVLAALDADPAITVLALPNVYWLDGTVLDLTTIARSAHARGACLVLDLSQSLGALPVDIATLRPDFVVAVGYKWLLGPYGLAYLWAARVVSMPTGSVTTCDWRWPRPHWRRY